MLKDRERTGPYGHNRRSMISGGPKERTASGKVCVGRGEQPEDILGHMILMIYHRSTLQVM